MGSTLDLLYEYTKDLQHLIKVSEEFNAKAEFSDKIPKVRKLSQLSFEELSESDNECILSVSRFLTDYGFSQTYESFECACSLFKDDLDRTRKALIRAEKRLKESGSLLYAGKDKENYLFDPNGSWELIFNKLLSGNSNEEAAARRKFYSKRINKLASPESITNAMICDKLDEVVAMVSPLHLEMSFIENDGILKETLPFHTNKTDLN